MGIDRRETGWDRMRWEQNRLGRRLDGNRTDDVDDGMEMHRTGTTRMGARRDRDRMA